MLEFDDIFTNALTTAVFFYGSFAILSLYALGTLWTPSQRVQPEPDWAFGTA